MNSSTELYEIETAALLKALSLVASHRWHKLGEHPLTRLKSVHLYQTQAHLPDDTLGRGKALSAVLQQAIASLTPSRAKEILQARLDRIPHQISASNIGLSLDRWYAIQRDEAIPELRTVLWEMERALNGGLEIPPREKMASLGASARSPDPQVSQQPEARAPLAPFLAPAPPVHKLVGREELLSNLKHWLLESDQVLIALQGLPGVGKTALLIALAHDPDIRGHFPDGVLWAGLGRQPDVLALLGTWAMALKVPAEEIARCTNAKERAWSVHAAIGSRRMLLVIDDAWQVDAALALKVGGPSCAHLVTTRLTSIALDLTCGGHVPVRELDTASGIRLLEQLAPQVARAEPQATQSLVQAVGGLPLALILMGRHLRKVSGGAQTRRVHQALQELQTAQVRLQLVQAQSPLDQSPDLPTQTPLSLQASIRLSDSALNQDAWTALKSLSLFPPKPNTFSETAALAVTGLPSSVLDVLADQGLLESLEPGRYTLHQTIADYARLRSVLCLNTEVRVEATDSEAVGRLARYGVQYSADHAGENELLDRERHNLLTALELAFEHGLYVELIQGVLALHPFLIERGLYAVAERHLSRALSLMSTPQYAALDAALEAKRQVLLLAHEKACDVLGKREEQRQDLEALEKIAEALDGSSFSPEGQRRAQIALRRANYALMMCDYAAAIRATQKAIELAQAVGDLAVQAEGYLQWGQAHLRQADYSAARKQLERVLLLTRATRVSDTQSKALVTSLLHLEAGALRHLGNASLYQSDYGGARDYYQQSLHLYCEIGDWQGKGQALGNLGIVYGYLGDALKAIEYHEQYLTIAHEIGDRRGKGQALCNLGLAYADLGDAPKAIEYNKQALVILREMGDRWGEGAILGNLGEAYAALGDACKAIEHNEQSLVIAREIGDRHWEGCALSNLGDAYLALSQSSTGGDETHRAIEFYDQALVILREIGAQRDEGETLWGKSQAFVQLSDCAQAITQAQSALEIWEQIKDPRADTVRQQLAQWQAGS